MSGKAVPSAALALGVLLSFSWAGVASAAPAKSAPPKSAPAKPVPSTTGKTAPSAKTAPAKPAAPAATPEDDPSSLEKAPATAAGAPVNRPPQPGPPDGKWLTDENGQQYFLEKLEKQEGTYRRLDEKTVRTRWGIPIEVAKEDDHFFYYKVYKVDPAAQGPVANAQPTQDEINLVEDTYRVDSQESNRLKAVPFSKGLPEDGQWRNGFDLADINGDGHLDIVHSPARKSLANPVVFLGDGKGNWRRWSEATYPRLAFDYGDAAVADFNGDGHLDMALGMHLRGFAVLVGDGKGKFTDWSKGLDFGVPGQKGADGSGFSSRAIAVIDWNLDGKPDLLALGEGPRLNVSAARNEGSPPGGGQSYGAVIYLNQGDGSWKRQDQGTGGGQVFGDEVVTGDFNGDRRLDFATGTNVMGLKSLVNYSRSDGSWAPSDIEGVRPSSYVRSVAAGDFNHDGRDDLAIGYISFELSTWRSGIDILYSRSSDRWERRVLMVEPGRNGVSGLAAGDLDGDKQIDLVAVTDDGRTQAYLGDGKGFFTRDQVTFPAVAGGCRGYHVQLGDLNGDGDDEIVEGFAGEASAMFAPQRCPSAGSLRAWDVEKVGESRSVSTKNP
ncbi:MAG TPA: VCBS repeat-containing protein [Thermoanaerobaculia bacterium]|nr:VCBS repeat-containing protein [Thermoanaerobaculia bacterium]